ncbi:SDR family oxidoreductase [Mycobacterium intracellulare]|uniref:SDR family oxidoreductase n=1 Tax=Mycobacterium intracellulare TaxID=1767 RepID=A0AAE4U7Z3_MYCIT|nr:SDR family oxidoreductase [Mycobacterium intracellulare]MCA2318608.1 SDR family oxidoreductase [Mycobacterium intracellulare]MCA2339087.1 SDR family oxidoreductase [Mycobacterium intracellulare]MDV6975543.1 SDR family oxidoreductase [Mycobacterium intracellulare]MDV6980607.1 SDR family oxidoreductase [Mycobacterium intracellulare]MDV7011036.1 SDR family oxidoreductase [Mycobacterium intracellulare]
MNAVTFDFAGAKVLVTGGTSGIGQEIATQFAKAGAAVTITGTRASTEDYDDDLSAFTYRQCQIRDEKSVDDLAASLGELDILVNNAGGPFPEWKDEWTPEGFALSLTQNLFGAMRLTMACEGLLKSSTAPGGANVVNTTSMSAFRSAILSPGYGSSKAALTALTWNLARRWCNDGIRVNAVAPGLIHTRLSDPGINLPQVVDVEIGFHTPLGRPGKPEDCWAAVLFLCSEPARYITGTTIAVDGGYLTV